MWLLPFLGAAFISVVSFLATYLTKRFAIIGAAIVVFLGLIATFRLAIEAALQTLSFTLPTGGFLFGLGLLPDNTEVCITALMTAQTASMFYRFHSKILSFKLRSI